MVKINQMKYRERFRLFGGSVTASAAGVLDDKDCTLLHGMFRYTCKKMSFVGLDRRDWPYRPVRIMYRTSNHTFKI